MTAYFIFDNVEVTDAAGLARYASMAPQTVADHGGRYLAVASTPDVVEGDPGLTSVVIIEFPDVRTARAWYDSPAYQSLKELRQRSVRNNGVIIAGIDSD